MAELAEGHRVTLIGEDQHLTVTATVAVSSKIIGRTVRMESEDTAHLLLTASPNYQCLH